MLNTKKIDFINISKVPLIGGVYAIWLIDECIYVGKSRELRKRIRSHFNGGRGGDQFCLYLFDSYIKTSLDGKGAEITKQLNNLTKEWARKNLTFTYAECEDYSFQENIFRKSMKPTLNPL